METPPAAALEVPKSHLSIEAALELIHAQCVNNGGGLPDVDHLWYTTDCPEYRCEADEWEPCPHGYLGSYNTGEALGWIDKHGNVTDSGATAELKWSLQ